MNHNIDSVNLELVITACRLEEDNIWMQGDLEIRLNTEKPYSESDIINVDELLKSLEQEGDFFIFSFSNWEFGIQVLHTKELQNNLLYSIGKTTL